MTTRDRERSVVEVLFSLGLGGSEIVGKDLAVGLQREQNYRCAVCAVEKGGILADELASVGIPTFIAREGGGGVMMGIMKLIRFLRLFRPAVVHTHHLNELFYGFIGAKLAGARIVHTEHEYYSLRGTDKKRMLRFLSLFCNHVTTVGEDVTEFLRNEVGIPSRKLVTIPNGISLPAFAGDYPQCRDALGIGKDETVIGIVARLEPVKGHDILFQAFCKVLTGYPRCRLLVVGDGSRREALEVETRRLGIAGNVTFLGARRDIAQILSHLDLQVLSSREEGLPVSILEGMAAGLPLVATAVGSIPEVIVSGENGLLVQPENVEELAEALTRLVREPELRARYGAAAHNTITSRFNFAQTLTSYHNIFSGC